MIRDAIAAAVAGRDLSEAQAAAVMEEMMAGEATAAQVGALLTALRLKGESVDEITGMVRVMREKALHVDAGDDVLDVVSTGGGSFDPFNISTAAALVCAGAGVRVAKHGNRGFTSTSGAADVLEALGAKLELEPAQVEACIEKSGFGFLFAQGFHPAMRFVAPARREIGIRTIFNSLGPLTNPAGARFQLIGAGTEALASKLAQVVARFGTSRTLIVHSEDGLDEVSLGAPTSVQDVRGSNLTSYTLTPEEAGFARLPLSAVKTGTAAENAARIRAVLAGTPGPDRDYVLVNAGVALLTVGRADTAIDGVRLAVAAVDSGAATRVLDTYIAVCQELRMTSRGITQTGSILDRIVADNRPLLAARQRQASEESLRGRFDAPDAQWRLSRSVARPRGKAALDAQVQIIAEIKKASPSKGLLAPDLDVLRVARAYTEGGAAGISILTEPLHFLGDLSYLRLVRETLAHEFPGERPSLLRKDFLVEPYELVESRAYGADNVLLIVALLETPLLRDLIQQAQSLDMDALVEVHNEAEAERAAAAGATLFGINNRDLHTFEVDLSTTERIRPLLPADAIVVGESGVHTRADVERLQRAGVRAILVGEAFMTAPDVAAKMAGLRM